MKLTKEATWCPAALPFKPRIEILKIRGKKLDKLASEEYSTRYRSRRRCVHVVRYIASGLLAMKLHAYLYEI